VGFEPVTQESSDLCTAVLPSALRWQLGGYLNGHNNMLNVYMLLLTKMEQNVLILIHRNKDIQMQKDTLDGN
jgi:hypothetical protein